MSDTLSLILPFKRVCNCRGISRDNVIAASQKGPFKDHAELHAAALEERRHDCIDGIGLPLTGAEGDDGYNCLSQACRPDFEKVVHYLKQTSQPKIGRCGNDCNSCPPKTASASGCTL